ncbi:MAG: FtsX-like permease family protein [Oscillospiraceae bacterium]|nr:FtsX-like permease family protein [Oscillospiraceae bacterium]
MRFASTLALKNIKRKPGRSVIMILLAAFLAFSIFAGSLVVLSLRNGLASYEARLGADVVVVPYEAQTKGALESILLQGIPGYFYMDESAMEKIRGMEGVEIATPQFYLASAKAGCCSVALQLIGFDPETDFTIQPWIQESYSGTVGYGDVIVGNHVSLPLNHSLTFYNQELRVVAQLDETGTGLDNAVYASMDTVRDVIKNAESLGFRYLGKVSADKAISSVMVKVADGYSTEAVMNDINVHVRKVEATQSKSMISSIAAGLSNVSRIITLLTVMIWILAIVILAVVFVLIANERKKEFAILRIVGASRQMLSRMLLTESALISAVGSVLGVGLAALVAFPFTDLIRTRLNLPYLLPDAGTVAALVLGALLASVLAGSLSSAVSARKLSRNDAGLVLREGA